MTNATLAICALGFIGCVWFVLSYHIRSGGQCWRNEVGVWLMISRIDLGGIFLLIASNRFFGDWFGRRELTLILVAIFALQTFWPGRLLWHAHTVVEPTQEESNDPR
jgi:hypothetical protein